MSFKNKRVLITGISGFAGSYLAQHLLDDGATVYGLDRVEGTPHKVWPESGSSEIRFVSGDIRDTVAVDQAVDVSKPDVVFHLAAHSFDPSSFTDPLEVMRINSLGTANVLEAVRKAGLDSKVVFAGSSEEYGIVVSSEEHLGKVTERFGAVFPQPRKIPELPVNEENPLRPISPYGVSKLHGDFLTRNYHHAYGVKTVVSRAFNHEGAGRGPMFVTSVIAGQVMDLRRGKIDRISLGNVNVFRDWSHVEDTVQGYCLLAERGESGAVYNQGSQRTNSVMTYLVLCLEEIGYRIDKVETLEGGKRVEGPTCPQQASICGSEFEVTRVDTALLGRQLEYTVQDRGLFIYTDKGKVLVEFDVSRFRPSDIPILLSDIGKIRKLGFKPKHTLRDIIRDQLGQSHGAKRWERRHDRG